MQYEAPATVEEAVTLLVGAGGEGRVLAGGTDLLVQLRSGAYEPELVVDVKRIDEMTEIAASDGGFRIGAAVCTIRLEEDEALNAAWPGVVEAARLIGSEQIQTRASLGGNLCNGSPAADTVPALIAANATVSIAGPNGRREAPGQNISCDGRDCDLLFPASATCKIGGCLFAANPPHGNGHCCGGRRRECDSGRQWRMHGRAGWARCRCTDSTQCC